MGEVIQFPDTRIKTTQLTNKLKVEKPNSRSEYLAVIKQHLTGDDYEEVLLGIMDKDYYETSDPDSIKKLIDNYFTFN